MAYSGGMVRRPRLGAALLAAAVSALTACSLLLESSGLSDGTDPRSDGAPLDADAADAPPTPDAAPSDAGLPDPPDGAADAPPDAAEPEDAGPWCTNGPNRFCDDFDEPAPGARWTRVERHKGELAFDGVGLSPPHALRTNASPTGWAYLAKTLPGSPSTIRCEFDAKIVTMTETGTADIFEITSELGGAPVHGVFLRSYGGTWCLAEHSTLPDGGEAYRCNQLINQPPVGSWFHVSVAMTPTSATIALQGASTKLDVQLPPDAERHVSLGLGWVSEAASKTEVLLDNLDCTF